MILFEASHTSHTRAQTGIQRVVRALFAALSAQERIEPVCRDPHQETWRSLHPWENKILTNRESSVSAHRSAKWPLKVRLAGYARRLLKAKSTCPPGDALIAPEIFSAKVGRALPELFACVRGPRVALFHDAIALKLPEFTPAKTVARFPAYLRELLAFDGVAAVSEDSRQSLVDYWRWLGVQNPPPVVTITNAVEITDFRHEPDAMGATANAVPVILCVGSIEGRKNHLALLTACEQLWAHGRRFQLRLIGLVQPQTGRGALEKIQALQAAGYPLTYHGPVDDAALAAAYAACTFTVYPSLMEGFGLPVQESIAYGKPCICSKHGALGESAQGGGCQALDQVDAPHLAMAIDQWLCSPASLEAAVQETHRRHFKTWQNSADELISWLRDLPRPRQ
jgi:glycosyltransferase involved in cell wall biosynthesis